MRHVGLWAILVGGLLLAGPSAGASAEDETQPSYLGKPLPELEVEEGRWFNAEEPPTLKGLRGGLVLVVLTSLW